MVAVAARHLHRERRVPPEELVDQHAERPPIRRERVAAAVGDLWGLSRAVSMHSDAPRRRAEGRRPWRSPDF